MMYVALSCRVKLILQWFLFQSPGFSLSRFFLFVCLFFVFFSLAGEEMEKNSLAFVYVANEIPSKRSRSVTLLFLLSQVQTSDAQEQVHVWTVNVA